MTIFDNKGIFNDVVLKTQINGMQSKLKWPPKIDKYITIQQPTTNETYVGIVREYIWNKTACVIQLNDNYNYTETTLKDEKRYNNGKNHIILLPIYNWQYVNNNHPTIKYEKNPIIQQHNKHKKEENEIITNEMKLETNNPYYKPLLSSNGMNFSILTFEQEIENEYGKRIELARELQQVIQTKLERFEKIKETDIRNIVNESIAINNLIIGSDDEINEGNKIIKQINKFSRGLFEDIEMLIHEGYVIIMRRGTNIANNVITKELVSNLKHLSWQYGKQINHDILKYIIFQNEYQKQINKEQLEEAENILKTEYVIGLQCKSKYLLWCLKRLVMIWYSETELGNIILKIKVLINQYRANKQNTYNIKNGILPMILIYPRYGEENIKKLLSKLEYYFSLYVNDQHSETMVYIPNSTPSYFLKQNNMIYYTNGSIDLKMYIHETKKDNTEISGDNIIKQLSTKIIL